MYLANLNTFSRGVNAKYTLTASKMLMSAYNAGFSLRILVARERCNITGECFEKGSRFHRLPNISHRFLHRKQIILHSPLPNEHSNNRSVFFYHDKKIKN